MGKYSVRLVRKGSKRGDGCVCSVKAGAYQNKRGRPKKQKGSKPKKRITPQLITIPPPKATVLRAPVGMTKGQQTFNHTVSMVANRARSRANYSINKSFSKRIRGW